MQDFIFNTTPSTVFQVGAAPRQLGIGEEHQLAADSMKRQRLLVNNLRHVNKADALAVHHAAW